MVVYIDPVSLMPIPIMCVVLFGACLPGHFLFETHHTALKQQLKQGTENNIWVHVRKWNKLIDKIPQFEGMFQPKFTIFFTFIFVL